MSLGKDITELPPRYARVLELRKHNTLREVGEILSAEEKVTPPISRERVRQMEAEALKFLARRRHGAV